MEIRPCFVEIDLDIIIDNFKNIKKYVQKDVIAVVKANAYGHGSILISKALVENGVSMLAVATVEEAYELREVFKSIPILILGPVFDNQKEYCIENNISFIVSSLEEAKYIDRLSMSIGKKALVHIAIDTGMSRVGYLSHNLNEDTLSELSSMIDCNNIVFEGIFTHFSCADEEDLDFTHIQYNRFEFIVNHLKKVGFNFKYIHCQNSAASISLQDDLCNYVRAGISLYGYYPSEYVEKNIDIKPALTWKCKVSHVKSLKKGTPIGYGATYTTDKDSLIATIPVGYADGFKRSLSNTYKVFCNGALVPIVGNVCMDQTMLDVTGIPCSIGDEVILLSSENSAENMASIDKTISYEILCGISNRVPRIYKSKKYGLKTNSSF